MIHSSILHEIVRKGEFSFAFVSKSGEIIEGEKCVCTSFFSSGRTMNVKWCDSGEIRKVRRCTVISINNEEVVL